jgi:hypothetical protein
VYSQTAIVRELPSDLRSPFTSGRRNVWRSGAGPLAIDLLRVTSRCLFDSTGYAIELVTVAQCLFDSGQLHEPLSGSAVE